MAARREERRRVYWYLLFGLIEITSDAPPVSMETNAAIKKRKLIIKKERREKRLICRQMPLNKQLACAGTLAALMRSGR